MDLHTPPAEQNHSPVAASRPHHRTRLVWKLSLGLCAAAMFVGAASVVKPPPRNAAANPGLNEFTNTMRGAFANAPAAAGTRENALNARNGEQQGVPANWKLLGMLESNRHIVLCYGTPDGPRYSVYSIHGDLQQRGMAADEVYRSFPDVDIENMHLEPGTDGPVMLMDKE